MMVFSGIFLYYQGAPLAFYKYSEKTNPASIRTPAVVMELPLLSEKLMILPHSTFRNNVIENNTQN